MSDDLNKKIKQIADILNQDTLPDNLKGLLSLLSSPGSSQESPPPETPDIKEERTSKGEMDDSIDMIRKVKNVMDRMNSANDPRIGLLTAIKPFLSSRRQSKLNNCVNMIRLASVTRLMDDTNK